MSTIRRDDAATRAQDKLREETTGLGHEARASPAGAAQAAGQEAQTARGGAAGAKRGGGPDALEAGEAAGFKNKWARELEVKSTGDAKGGSQDSHDQRAQDASKAQKVSDIIQQELQKRV